MLFRLFIKQYIYYGQLSVREILLKENCALRQESNLRPPGQGEISFRMEKLLLILKEELIVYAWFCIRVYSMYVRVNRDRIPGDFVRYIFGQTLCVNAWIHLIFQHMRKKSLDSNLAWRGMGFIRLSRPRYTATMAAVQYDVLTTLTGYARYNMNRYWIFLMLTHDQPSVRRGQISCFQAKFLLS